MDWQGDDAMNIYKNLMFLHGHFVDPRDADEDGDDGAQSSGRAMSTAATGAGAKVVTRKVIASRAATGSAAAKASHHAQPAQRGAITGWRAWLRLWPSETAKVEVECDARGCV
jgi:hypothetical protein